MRLSHKKKIVAKRNGKHFKSYVMATGNSLHLGGTTGKNTKHTFVAGTTRKGKVIPFTPYDGEGCNFEQLVSHLPINNSGKSRVVDSIINSNKD